ncbi:hypothetical protein ABH920_003732 [Catenulispora sp. EB89]|uniref:hypothetical protein n=1 Tax=Catenulispora sp. EB89 TaxID=3156257 RepID=UPI003511D003
MTTTHVIINAMDVGQGLGTFVQLFDQDPEPEVAPTNTILLDFGSYGGDSDVAAKPRVAWLVDQLKRMPQPTIDAVYLSHGDLDHFNLMPQLLARFTPYDPSKHQTGPSTLWIRYARYAGERDHFVIKEVNVLDKIATYMVANENPLRTTPTAGEFNGTSFRGLRTDPDFSVDNLSCYIVAENLGSGVLSPIRRKGKYLTHAYGKNTRSIVLLLAITDWEYQFVSTGDATGRTLLECNRAYAKLIPDGWLNNVVGMTVPHHGARRTLDIKPAGSNPTPEQVVSAFADWVKPRALFGSASLAQHHHHPDAEVLRYLWDRIPPGDAIYNDPGLGGRHFYNAYFEARKYDATVPDPQTGTPLQVKWPPATNFYSVKTSRPVYTNIYYSSSYRSERDMVFPPAPAVKVPLAVGKQPVGVTWVMKLQKGVTPTMDRLSSRTGAYAADFREPSAPGVAVRRPDRPSPRPTYRATPVTRPAGPTPDRPGSARRPAPGPGPGPGRDHGAGRLAAPRTLAPRDAHDLRRMAVIL